LLLETMFTKLAIGTAQRPTVGKREVG
jgi:hypothetical protein